MCHNGRYTERGVKELDGYGSEAWRVEAGYAFKLDDSLETVGVLMEPTSVVAKAWEQIDAVGTRTLFAPERVLVTGAGCVGLLAALFGVQRGLDVHVLDEAASGAKQAMVEALDATYHSGRVSTVASRVRFDVIVETTGLDAMVYEATANTPTYGILCLTGASPGGRRLTAGTGDANREVVVENNLVFGSINANHRHYYAAGQALAKADLPWLEGLISRRVPLDRYAEAFTPQPDDIKVVLTLTEG
jgi:threonine dehydrogenase-like Zn-dependent dehydrogenase